MRKPAFCICANKGADQMLTADKHICFHYIDNTIHLIPKTEILRLWPFSVAVQPGLCWTWLETLKTGLLATWHK